MCGSHACLQHAGCDWQVYQTAVKQQHARATCMRVATTQIGFVMSTLAQPARKATVNEGPTPISCAKKQHPWL